MASFAEPRAAAPRGEPGRVTESNLLQNSGGTPRGSLRVFGAYALVYVVAGAGSYRDARRARQPITPGDCILVLPELGQYYGAPRDGRWDEYYITFEGPLFELWRAAGWLDASRLVYRLEPLEKWVPRFQAFAETPRGRSRVERAREVAALQTLLADIMETAPEAAPAEPAWLTRARRQLDWNLELPYDGPAVAQYAGLSYQAFRKSFAREMGVSPSRYRSARVMEAAEGLMRHGNLTNAEIAQRLGFADEGHFSKRFKSVTGQTPRAFRQSLRARGETEAPQG